MVCLSTSGNIRSKVLKILSIPFLATQPTEVSHRAVTAIAKAAASILGFAIRFLFGFSRWSSESGTLEEQILSSDSAAQIGSLKHFIVCVKFRVQPITLLITDESKLRVSLVNIYNRCIEFLKISGPIPVGSVSAPARPVKCGGYVMILVTD